MFGIGTPEIILILLVVLILFGGKKLPEFSRGLGEALREIRKGLAGDIEKSKDTKKKKG